MNEPVESKLPHAVDVCLTQIGAHDTVSEQGQPLAQISREDGEADQRGGCSNLDLQVRPNEGKRIVNFNRGA